MLKDKKYRRGLESSLAEEDSTAEEYDEEGSTLEDLDEHEYLTATPELKEPQTSTANYEDVSSTEADVSVFKKILWNSFMKKIEMREIE